MLDNYSIAFLGCSEDSARSLHEEYYSYQECIQVICEGYSDLEPVESLFRLRTIFRVVDFCYEETNKDSQ